MLAIVWPWSLSVPRTSLMRTRLGINPQLLCWVVMGYSLLLPVGGQVRIGAVIPPWHKEEQGGRVGCKWEYPLAYSILLLVFPKTVRLSPFSFLFSSYRASLAAPSDVSPSLGDLALRCRCIWWYPFGYLQDTLPQLVPRLDCGGKGLVSWRNRIFPFGTVFCTYTFVGWLHCDPLFYL